jgi:RNA polymerase primary sigma factor
VGNSVTITAGKKIVPDLEDWDLDSLPSRQAAVIRMRFGIPHGSRRHTLEEAGEVLGVKRERVREIQLAAVCKLLSNRSERG